MGFLRHFLATFLIILLLAALGFLWLRSDIEQSVGPYLYTDPHAVPSTPVVMVLGAQALPGLVPSRALAYRLSAAVELYKSGRAQKLLMSGDGRSPDYDEVGTMRQYALDAGVPDQDILEDRSGLRTYDSCARAKSEFGLQQLAVVSQRDHLLRAVYTCRQLGLQAVGLVAPEFGSPSPGNYAYWEYKLREQGALLSAWVELHL